MASERGDVVARARSLVGVRFRPQGRSADDGLDCIGVMILAAGIPARLARTDYALRFGDAEQAALHFERSGLIRVASDRVMRGDIVLVQSGPAQLHAAVLTDAGYVHAHAGLRRVVETPGRLPWPVLSAWRASAVAS